MFDLVNIKPVGCIEGAFAGFNDKGLFLEVKNHDLDTYFLALFDKEEHWLYLQNKSEDVISFSALYELLEEDKEYRICVIYKECGQQKAAFLRNEKLKVPKVCTEEMYDRRQLFGEPVLLEKDTRIIPFYQPNKLLGITKCSKEERVFLKQIRNEIVYEDLVDETEDTRIYNIYTKCKKIQGNYVGIIHEDFLSKELFINDCIEYSVYEEDNRYAYMSFNVTEEVKAALDKFYMVWTYQGNSYYAPLSRKCHKQFAMVTEINEAGEKNFTFTISLDEALHGEYVGAEFITDGEEWDEKNYMELQGQKTIGDDGKALITYEVSTIGNFDKLGSWYVKVYTCKDAISYGVDVTIAESLINKVIYDDKDTKYKLTFKKNDNVFVVNRGYGHNALFDKNIQFKGIESLEEVLGLPEVKPKGNMYAEFVQDKQGLKIRLYQYMKDVIEAKLVMYNSQGLGVLSSQNIEVVDGIIREFQVQIPDIDWDNKFLKPVTSVWFRITMMIRSNKGIYFVSLMHYDLDTSIERVGYLYDTRKLYLNPIGQSEICGINMDALPYYAEKKSLSMKYVRPEQLYRSQFTNELLDVKIKNDILTIKMRCRDCGGEYKGVLMEYRKVKEEDTETYFIPYETLKDDHGFYIMTTKIDMKKYYMRMLYWDIRCAFEIDGTMYTVSCHSNNNNFLRKYKKIFVDRSYPNDNSIMFPYATSNGSVALMHREVCPQDHWNFRLKEKMAEIIYRSFKNHWNNKNIYLIFEKYCTMAQDNGYFFFKYCMDAEVEHDFDGEIYYVIEKNAADWEKVLPYKKHVLKYLSMKHMIYLQACKLMISTDTKGHAYVWRSMGSDIKALTYKKKLVFLQHGVTAFKRGHFERGTNVGCESFITTSQFEHDIIHNYLGYPEEEIPITGFARWDVLRDKSEGHREILMMPTWRTWLDDAENDVFAESDYCKNYMALLNNPKLDQILQEYDVTLNFYLHPKFRKFITEFSVVSDHICLIPFGEAPLNELMMQCNLLITDFSSVAWDVYYMNKPVLFYHFDIDDASKTLGFYMDMKNDLFGDRAEKPDELMDLIIEYIESDFAMKEEYSKDREKYFAYVDDNNSERIWESIQERQW